MEKLYKFFAEKLSLRNIRDQLNTIYRTAILLPMLVIGGFLVVYISILLGNHYSELSDANNNYVWNIFDEMTTQLTKVSWDIANDSRLEQIVSREYANYADFTSTVSPYDSVGNYVTNYTEIKDIYIYSENPTIQDYGCFRIADSSLRSWQYYEEAMSHDDIIWLTDASALNLPDASYVLVRRVSSEKSKYRTFVVMEVNTDYLNSKLRSTGYESLILDRDYESIFNSMEYSEEDLKSITKIVSTIGSTFIRGEKYQDTISLKSGKNLMTVSRLKIYRTDNPAYICSFNRQGYANRLRVIIISCMAVALCIVVSYLVMAFFAKTFSTRIGELREAMHGVSQEQYDVPYTLKGNDEVSEAYQDLKKMVEIIKQKDESMFAARINEERFAAEQQMMEYKMLSSQINPHFLYNTLEAIRMRAIASSDREVADAIKMLGKSLRYVLENTGTVSVPLQRELDYIGIYIKIIQFRFSDKITYSLSINEDVDPESYSILPLLLQPIVENAIVHGLENAEKGCISITVSEGNENETISIKIRDDGCGMDSATLEALRSRIAAGGSVPGKSIGLYNINQRIKLYYGSRYGMEVDSLPGAGTNVTVTIPMRPIV